METVPAALCHFAFIVAVGPRSAGLQHGWERNLTESIAHRVFRLELGGQLRPDAGEFFMLMTWLFSVRRSIKAAVRRSSFRNERHSLNFKLEVSGYPLDSPCPTVVVAFWAWTILT
jgi:hypothetical protein